MKQLLRTFLLAILSVHGAYAQYNQYVEVLTLTVHNESYGIIKMNRKDNHVKVKYFAARDNEGNSVDRRYRNWAVNKKIIALSSGTYMTSCDASIARPVGLCIDQGRIVNRAIINDGLDGMMIVYPNGGMVATNLRSSSLTIYDPDSVSVRIRDRDSDRQRFIRWGERQEATVFQSHLLVYKNQLTINSNVDPNRPSSKTPQERKFLAVCKLDNGGICHYIINLSTPSTLYQASMNVLNYLKKDDDVSEVVFMTNLDTGCQNFLNVFDSNGNLNNRLLVGTKGINNAVNLLVYYYE